MYDPIPTKVRLEILTLVFRCQELVKSYCFWLFAAAEKVNLEGPELTVRRPAFEATRNRWIYRIAFLGKLLKKKKTVKKCYSLKLSF